MAIIINNVDKTYTLTTKNTMYQMKVDALGVLEHTYYGAKMDYMDMHYGVECVFGASFSPNPQNMVDVYSYNALHQELSCAGIGDFRLTAMGVRNGDGSFGAEPDGLWPHLLHHGDHLRHLADLQRGGDPRCHGRGEEVLLP